MIQFSCLTRLPSCLSEEDLERIAEVVSRGLKIRRSTDVSLRFVSLAEIHKLNKQYRHKDKPTDVLSFGLAENMPAASKKSTEPVELGDLVICAAYAKDEAKRRGIEWREELVRLIVHGALHLSGYDHQTLKDEEKMFALQESWVEQAML